VTLGPKLEIKFAELSADAAPGGVQTESHKTFVSNLKNGTVLLDVSHFSKLRMTGEPKMQGYKILHNFLA